MNTGELSTQGSFSQTFTGLIKNNIGGRAEQTGSRSAGGVIYPVQRAQLGQPGGPSASGQPGGLAVNFASGRMLQWPCCLKPSSPLPSHLCSAVPQLLPPPRLLGKFSIRAAGRRRCACRRAGGSGGGKGWGRGTAAGSKLGRGGQEAACAHTDAHARTHEHTRARTHACTHTHARPPARRSCNAGAFAVGPAGSCARARRDCGTAPRGGRACRLQPRGAAVTCRAARSRPRG